MNTPAMLNLHQDGTPWVCALQGHQATTLAADAVPRWLRVDAGCLWVTARQGTGQGHAAAADIWLGADDHLALPAGSEWVLQAWPQARLSLLVAAPAAVSRGLGVLSFSARLWARFSVRFCAFRQRPRSSATPRAAAC